MSQKGAAELWQKLCQILTGKKINIGQKSCSKTTAGCYKIRNSLTFQYQITKVVLKYWLLI